MAKLGYTILRGFSRPKPMILGYALAFLLCGCTSTGVQSPKLIPPRAAIAPQGEHPAVAAAETELGDAAAEALPPIEHTPPLTPDPGAEALLNDLLACMEDRRVGADGFTLVSLTRLRNHSRAAASEFIAFRQRLAEVLTRRGADLGVRFSTNGEPADYRIDGTAYLVTADGFDQWELYLRLSPADAAWTLWQSEQPIRVLRQARPDQPLFTTIPGPVAEPEQPAR